MKVGIAVFAYNRSWHFQQVLNGLRKNDYVNKLYIFQDGLKCEEHREEWEKVRKIIDNITWCDKHCCFSDYNKGLACSIVEGVNLILKENDAAIVLEDDCVPAANFVSFMIHCFQKYKDDKRIFTVSGYSWPIKLRKSEYDIYGCGRISSWGWGTWRDRWDIYEKDYEIIRKMKQKEEPSRNLATWGSDLEEILVGNIRGICDSWAVFWALNVIERNGICINPYQSFIKNIGTDGSGVHCGGTNKFDVECIDEKKEEFYLPDTVDISDDTKEAFITLYGSCTAVNTEKILKENILIYGLGNFYGCYEKDINIEYNIIAFIDKKKKGWYAGKKIIRLSEISKYKYDNIVIMIQDVQECINISKDLINNNIDVKKIILGHNKYGKYSNLIDGLSIMSDGKMLLKFGNVSIAVQSKDEFNNVCEVFLNEAYKYYINNGKSDIVFDIGMNIGDSTLYFLNQNNIEKVYGYEPFNETFNLAKQNLKEYLDNSKKIEIFQCGISNENAKRIIKFNSNMTCGQSTISNIREKAYTFYLNEGLINLYDEQIEEIEVKRASEVIGIIKKKYPGHNLILRMDCEGEEYCILEELLENRMLNSITYIMLEWHYRGKDIILKYLKEAGFSWWCNDKDNNMGLIYAYKNHRI